MAPRSRPVTRRGSLSPRAGYGMHTTAYVRTSPPSLWGRTDSAEGRARRGSPGMERLVDEALSRVSRRNRGLTNRLPLAPAADVAAAYFDQEAYARRPLLARPS